MLFYFILVFIVWLCVCVCIYSVVCVSVCVCVFGERLKTDIAFVFVETKNAFVSIFFY